MTQDSLRLNGFLKSHKVALSFISKTGMILRVDQTRHTVKTFGAIWGAVPKWGP